MMTTAHSVFLLCLLVTIATGQVTDHVTCQGPGGNRVRVGTAWVAQDGCNVCTCTQFGVECQTWKNCNNQNHLGAPGDPICTYAQGEQYTVGQRWRTKDGCNHCVCLAQAMNCTAQPCVNTGFATPKPPGSHIEFMDCPYKNHVYRYGDHFMADDGCNTCVCLMPGNYATFPACTTTPCDLLG